MKNKCLSSKSKNEIIIIKLEKIKKNRIKIFTIISFLFFEK